MTSPLPTSTNVRRRGKQSSNISLAQLANLTYASGWDHPPAVASPASSADNISENYGGWKSRPCHWKTPQRLFTLDPNKKSKLQQEEQQPKEFTAGNLFCAPIIVYSKYILVASGMSISLYGNFDNEAQHEESIQTRINTTITPPLTQFSLCSDIDGSSLASSSGMVQMTFHEETSILYVLTVESCIFQVKLIIDQPTTTSSHSIKLDATPKPDLDSRNKDILSDDSGGDCGSSVVTPPPVSSKPPKFRLMHNWVTEKLGATCMATLNDGGGIGIDTICVGYKSGYIEAWNVNQIHSLHPKHSVHGTKHQRKTSEQGFSLHWEGYMYDSVRTLSFLFRSKDPQKESLAIDDASAKSDEGSSKLDITKSLKTGNIESVERAKEHYLLTVVARSTRKADKGKQQPTSSMLKILDLKRIMNNETKKKTDLSRVEEMSLQKYTLPQSQGMELMDATTIPLSEDCRLPKRVPILENHGADAACILSSARSGGGGKNEKSCVGITFPDGITSLLSSSSSSQDELFDAVGIAEENHQVLLSYPAIGNGQLEINGKNGKVSSYLATCLRGGTCYLIPTTSDNKSDDEINNSSIATIPFPHDIQSDLPNIYVQAFTAGNLIVDGSLLPILIYAWPGGVIDVYASGLIHSKPSKSDESSVMVDDDTTNDDNLVSRVERRALQDLIDNESLLLLSKIVDELRDDSRHPLLQREEWQQFLTETKAAGKALLPNSVDNIAAFDSLCSIQQQNLRRILLSLSLSE